MSDDPANPPPSPAHTESNSSNVEEPKPFLGGRLGIYRQPPPYSGFYVKTVFSSFLTRGAAEFAALHLVPLNAHQFQGIELFELINSVQLTLNDLKADEMFFFTVGRKISVYYNGKEVPFWDTKMREFFTFTISSRYDDAIGLGKGWKAYQNALRINVNDYIGIYRARKQCRTFHVIHVTRGAIPWPLRGEMIDMPFE